MPGSRGNPISFEREEGMAFRRPESQAAVTLIEVMAASVMVSVALTLTLCVGK